MPVIIPLLATGYLLTIYLLLTLAQRTIKNPRYAGNSFTDAYNHTSSELISQGNEIEQWSLRVNGVAPLTLAQQGASKAEPSGLHQQDALASKELAP